VGSQLRSAAHWRGPWLAREVGLLARVRTADELQRASQVLEYELGMLGSLSALLDSDTMKNAAAQNALVESFGIHTRVLHGFFFGDKRQPSDVVAGDFFDDPEEWRRLCPAQTETLRRACRMASKQIAHFTEERLNLTEEDKAWPFHDIVRDLSDALMAFLGSRGIHREGSKWRVV